VFKQLQNHYGDLEHGDGVAAETGLFLPVEVILIMAKSIFRGE
jgi:hypothetical protein